MRGARLLARLIPAIEVVTAGLLLALPHVGAAVTLVALAAFSTVLVVEVRAGRSFNCGCFGGAGHDAAPRSALFRNGLLLVLAGAVAALPSGRPAAGAVLAGVGLGLLFLLGELSFETLRGNIA